MTNTAHCTTPALAITRRRQRRHVAAIVLALAACVPALLPGGEAPADEASARNAWPFPGFSAAERRAYADERASVVAVNLMLGTAIVTVQNPGGVARSVELPLGRIDPAQREVVPILPVRSSRAAALGELPRFREFRDRGMTPVLFYREHGLIWPTVLTPETAPRILAVYPLALAAAQADARATRDAFIDVAFWYVGARFAGSTRARTDSAATESTARVSTARSGSVRAAPAAGTPAGRVIIPHGRKVSDAEREIMHKLASEGRTVEALVESTRKGQQTADFLVDGVRTELKTVSNITRTDISTPLKRTIESGAGQAPHIIVDVRGQARMTAKIAREAAGRAMGNYPQMRQVRLIGDGFDFTVFPKPR